MLIPVLVGFHFLNLVSFTPETFLSGQVWRIITFPVFSMLGVFAALGLYFFYRFGSPVESALGRKDFFITSGLSVLATPVCMLLGHFLGLPSGVYELAGSMNLHLAMFCAFCVMHPNVPMAYIGIPIKWLGLVFFVVSVLTLLGARAVSAAIGTTLSCAVLIWYIQSKGLALVKVIPDLPKGVRKKKKVKNAKVVRSPKPKITPKATIPRDTEIDAILDKISAEGLHSLTQDERATLENANKKNK